MIPVTGLEQACVLIWPIGVSPGMALEGKILFLLGWLGCWGGSLDLLVGEK